MVKGVGIVGGLTLISRVLGFIREMIFAHLLGAALAADIFFVAFRIPNLLRSLVAEGALTSAFVPVFATALNKSKEEAQQTLRAAVALLLATTALLSGLGILFADELVYFFAPGFGVGTPKATFCVTLTQIMFPYIAFVSLVAIVNAALNTIKIFGAGPLAQITVNCVLVAAALLASFFPEHTAVLILAWSVILAGILEVVVQFPALRRAQLSLRPSSHLITPATIQIIKLMLPAIFGAAIYQVAILLNTMLASLLREGSVAWLSYADRLSQLPIGIFTVALGSVLLPTLASAAAQKDEQSFGKTLVNSLRYTSFLIVPISGGLFFYAEDLVRICFQRGAFSPLATSMTAMAVQAMALGLWGVSCSSMLMRSLIARKDTATPALIAGVALLFNLLIALLLMGAPVTRPDSEIAALILQLRSWLLLFLPSYSLYHAGLALASGAASTFSVILLMAVLSKRFWVPWSIFGRATLKALAATSVMLLALHFWKAYMFQSLGGLVSGTALGMAVFLWTAKILHCQELEETFTTILRLIKRRLPCS